VTGKPRRNQFLATDGTRMKHGFVFPSPSGLKSLWQNIPLFFQAPFRSGIFWNLADDAAATALQSRGRENRQNGHRCSGGHPACRRAVASSPAANNVGHPPGPGYFMTRQNPTVISGRQDGRPPRQAGRPPLHFQTASNGAEFIWRFHSTNMPARRVFRRWRSHPCHSIFFVSAAS